MSFDTSDKQNLAKASNRGEDYSIGWFEVLLTIILFIIL